MYKWGNTGYDSFQLYSGNQLNRELCYIEANKNGLVKWGKNIL